MAGTPPNANGTVPLQAVTDDLNALIQALPPALQEALRAQEDIGTLLEVVIDLGRPPEARFPSREVDLSTQEVTEADIQWVLDHLSPFGEDNRAGIARTLHRISAIRNRSGKTVGLTCRAGRAIFGTARVVEDLVMDGKSVLLLGRPGVGKTTMLREVARVLADTAHKRVVIVDTSNEIAGDGDIPHPAIGRARRMQVRAPALQHAVMIEAVENHMPEAIIIDEMGTEQEAAAARTIAERGVQLIATAHGNTLENLLVNPTLADLVGGVHTVTLSDEEARRRRTQKTILERRSPPTFDVLVEIRGFNQVAVHGDVARTVDRILRGEPVTPETRALDADGRLVVGRDRRVLTSVSRDLGSYDAPVPPATRYEQRDMAIPQRPVAGEATPSGRASRIFPFGVSRDRLQTEARMARTNLQPTDTLEDADLVLTTKSHYRQRPGLLQAAEQLGKPVFVLRRNTPDQIRTFLRRLRGDANGSRDVASLETAAQEAEQGVEQVLRGDSDMVELLPQSAFVRRVQHRIVEQAKLRSLSVGEEPRRRVTIQRG